MKRPLTLTLVAGFFLLGCGPNEAAVGDLEGEERRVEAGELVDPCSMLGTRSAPLDLVALPEGGDRPYLSAIGAARRSLRIMVYQLTSAAIREAIRAKAVAGVDVRIILDVSQTSANQRAFGILTAAGAKVRWSDPSFTYNHAKFMVVDEVSALVSTGNLDTSSKSARNYLAIDSDLDDVKSLAALFDADWNKVPPQLTCTRLVVSPNNARARHLDLFRSARRTLDIESMQFSDPQIRKVVLERKQAGVTVRLLLASPFWVTTNRAAATWAASNGIEARWRSSPALHVKSFIVDGARAFFGSENLTFVSLSQNREVGLATSEADDLALMSSTFESDWASATRF